MKGAHMLAVKTLKRQEEGQRKANTRRAGRNSTKKRKEERQNVSACSAKNANKRRPTEENEEEGDYAYKSQEHLDVEVGRRATK